MKFSRFRTLSGLLLLALSLPALAQRKITSPKEQYGHNVGDDYFLSTYTQFEAYVKKVAQESDRMKLVSIGKSEEGREEYMAIVTAPENLKNLSRYQEISRRLANAEGLTEAQARELAREGKAVVWIDGGLHATEVLGAAQLTETIYQLNSRTDEETLRILRDCIVLLVHANPDGQELVSSNYMRNPDPTKRRYVAERLYQKYTGHDNNRDFYMNTQAETRNMNRQIYIEWIPQILYNHHQTGPAGAVLFCPPFRDPFSYYFEPQAMIGLDQIGAAMQARFYQENKPGAVTKSGASYSVWYNGGLRTTSHYHNILGLLTETIGNPTPMNIPFVTTRQLPNSTLPFPIGPRQTWHLQQSVDYSLTANYAVLDFASKHRADLLFNIYKMGANNIEKGNRDHWTMLPSRIDWVNEQVRKDRAAAAGEEAGRFSGNFGNTAPVPMKYYEMLRKPEWRDPRGFIISPNQPDFATAIKFTRILQELGLTVHRATAAFTVNGKQYPAGSIIFKSAQAFRAHLLDMFEPQDHPNEFRFAGGPPIPPYDSAGWTLAFQMGVQFDRILDSFDGPFERLTSLAPLPASRIEGTGSAGYILSHQVNDSFKAINLLLAAGEEVYWLKPTGDIYVPAKASTRKNLEAAVQASGVTARALAAKPTGDALKLKPMRIGLWDTVGGSMPSGWTRWLLEKFNFPFEVVYPPTLDQGDLRSKYDVLVFVSGAISERTASRGMNAESSPDMLPEWKARVGQVSAEKTVPQLRKFMESGGTVLTIGSSTSLARLLGLPVANHLVEKLPNGTERPLPQDKYYVPGSLLQASIDNTNPLAYGMPDKADFYFSNSPVFSLKPEAALQNVKPVAWFPTKSPLRSGWAWGQHYLEGGVAVAEAQVGEGKLLLYGPEVLFRAQPHGTFKLFFNGLYYGTAESTKVN
ncbi:MAG: M14 family metallopeptidase [Bryobacter sp.]